MPNTNLISFLSTGVHFVKILAGVSMLGSLMYKYIFSLNASEREVTAGLSTKRFDKDPHTQQRHSDAVTVSLLVFVMRIEKVHI